MQIKLSRKAIVGAILHNNDAAYSGVEKVVVGIFANGEAAMYPTNYGHIRGIRSIDPQDLVRTPDDDTYMFRREAHGELVAEGCVRDVGSLERTADEDALINERANAYVRAWSEQIEFLESLGGLTIAWVE